MVEDERREFQRLKLARPILATIGEQSALVLDIGVGGALVEHYGESSPGDEIELRFRWEGHNVSMTAVVSRSTIARQTAGDGTSVLCHSAIQFTDVGVDSFYWLQQMMATFVGRVLAAQRANAKGDHRADTIDGTASLADLGAARRSRTRGFMSYRLKESGWWKVPTNSPKQPPDGFTVAASEDENELEVLCRAFENADDEGRKMIRLVAELSTVSVNRAP